MPQIIEEVKEALSDHFDTEHDPNKGPKKPKRFSSVIIIGILLLCVVLLCFSIFTSHKKQKELQEVLERQNLVIDALEKKQGADIDTSKSVPVISSQTLKSELNNLQDLVTQEYIYTNSDKREQDAKWLFGWSRPFSNSSILVTYDGTIKAGINMSEVQVDVDEESRTIFITVPDSKILENNIPQESIEIVEVKDGLFNEVSFDDYNSFISEQKIVMEQKAIDRGILAKADEEAQKAIKAFLSNMPWMEGENAYKLVIQ